MSLPPYSARPDGVRLAVRLTPRAGRDGTDGIVVAADGRPELRLRLAAQPVEGAANKALIAYLATSLGLRKAEVAIASGLTGRSKQIMLSGDPATLLTRLDNWISA